MLGNIKLHQTQQKVKLKNQKVEQDRKMENREKGKTIKKVIQDAQYVNSRNSRKSTGKTKREAVI